MRSKKASFELGAPQERSYELLNAFLRGLSHRIRTPLSVISNELSALGADPAGRVLCGSGRCREISAILREAQGPRAPEWRAVTAGEVAEALELPAPREDAGVRIRASLEMLQYARRLAATLLPEADIALSPSERGMFLYYRAQPYGEGGQVHAASFTDYFCRCCDFDSFAPPMIDAVLEAHGAQIRIWADAELQIDIEFPVE